MPYTSIDVPVDARQEVIHGIVNTFRVVALYQCDNCGCFVSDQGLHSGACAGV